MIMTSPSPESAYVGLTLDQRLARLKEEMSWYQESYEVCQIAYDAADSTIREYWNGKLRERHEHLNLYRRRIDETLIQLAMQDCEVLPTSFVNERMIDDLDSTRNDRAVQSRTTLRDYEIVPEFLRDTVSSHTAGAMKATVAFDEVAT
jgi:hypothetical protein